ncbi:hypothetical protein KC19_9G057200 [Ceratodon purpureus]|uniref:Uncharacterized protein n=1 Tax=Ceratodon purpureus TaxID=3225 RepID=A0A8T0GQY3_CERPU|nr:hypothetical protein KC19_9G057200 [Ceratodon purpureus]
MSFRPQEKAGSVVGWLAANGLPGSVLGIRESAGIVDGIRSVLSDEGLVLAQLAVRCLSSALVVTGEFGDWWLGAVTRFKNVFIRASHLFPYTEQLFRTLIEKLFPGFY